MFLRVGEVREKLLQRYYWELVHILGTVWSPDDPLLVAVSSVRLSADPVHISRRSRHRDPLSMLLIANALNMSASSLKAALPRGHARVRVNKSPPVLGKAC